MNDIKKITPNKILWVDLEMTGLNPNIDRIVEVAAIVTDWDFKELASFESGVGQDEKELKELFAANPWCMTRPKETQAEIDLSLNSPAEKDVEAELVKFVEINFAANEPVLLA